MKKVVLCLLLILSFFVLFACASVPPESESAPSPGSSSAPASSPASTPAASTPAPQPQQPSNQGSSSSTPYIILDGAETYTVVWGDTLTKIAKSKYQNGFYYPLIMMASSNVVKDQDKIIPGMRLTIPRLQVNLNDSRAKESIKKYFLEIASLTERKRPRDAAGLRNLANSL
jgi:Tfp pilus assembly protein FimV